MTTKDQERQAITEIRRIVEGLGENSYVGTAMEGVKEDCKRSPGATDKSTEHSEPDDNADTGVRRTHYNPE